MKKSLLIASAALLAAMPLSAQKLTTGYVDIPASEGLPTYIQQWNGGTGTLQVNGKAWEDANFFVSRVKPKARFYSTGTQVYESITQWSTTNTNGNDKRAIWWVPIGDPGTNALPNGTWDQEPFSMWSYLDVYGDWTSPYGWTPGAFADAAHKHGVSVHGVASVPFGGISTTWANALNSMVTLTADQVGKFLYYFGQDGLGYNSEWSSWAPKAKGLTALHEGLQNYMNGRDPLWEIMWYAGTTDAGGISFDSGVGSGGGNTELYKSASMFLNYNWNNAGRMASSVSYSEGVGKSPFYIYCGMDQEGSQPHSGENYSLLKDYKQSIGVWGAHRYNMFWQGRGSAGTTIEATQKYYTDLIERWFGNAKRNPAIKLPITTTRSHYPKDNWAGYSSMMSERSTLSWTLKDEPFYSFFNLGNGKFFNWKGERVSNNEWYSLGIQDYMPNWRFWFAPTYLQKNVTEGTVHMDARFTWDDAYVGGSCLKIEGTSSKEFLHLFKTQFSFSTKTKVRVTYKILNGKADVKLVLGNNSNSTTPKATYDICSQSQCADIEDNSYREGAAGWTVWESGTLNSTQARSAVGVIALEFDNAEDLEMLLGGIELINDYTTVTPATPVITSSKVLANSYTGVDGKIIWNMPNDKAVGEPCYNSDVNTSLFKVYSQEEGLEPQFVGATTSWAAIAFRSPNTDASKKIRFGVAAVSMDTQAEGEIAWGEWHAKGTYTASNDIQNDKPIIKPGEGFTLSYVDQNHSASTWTLVNQTGTVMAQSTGTELAVPNGLPAVGGYDLYLDRGTANERVFGYYVQITGEGVGAIPAVYTIARNNQTVDTDDAAAKIELTDTPTLSYTGRPADGSASRAMELASRYIGCDVNSLGISAQQPLSVAGWFYFTAIPEKSWNFMNVSNKTASWPQNTWGWAWNHGHPDGTISCTFRGNASDSGSPGELHYEFPETKLQAGVWTHIAWTIDYTTSGFRCQLFINGVKQRSTVYQYSTGNNSGSCRTVTINGKSVTLGYTTTNSASNPITDYVPRQGLTDGDTYIPGQTYGIASTDRVYFGGAAHEGSSIDGIVDDFQVWSKAMTVDDVKLSMAGINSSNLPSDVITLWDFESDPGADLCYTGIGSRPSTKCFSYNVADGAYEYFEPVNTTGCPFLAGTAYPVATEAVWTDDADRRTTFTKTAGANGADESGTAKVGFRLAGDHAITLTLENNYGSDSKTFPVFSIAAPTGAIDGVEAEGDVETYTIDNVLYLEFAADGAYSVEVYNMAGMVVAAENLNAVAGQNAQITLGNAGVYLVKVVKDGQVLRTLKVVSK